MKNSISLSLTVIALLGLKLNASAAALINVSPGTFATVSQSSDIGYPAYNALNRNYGDFTHTGAEATDNWWLLDLGSPVPIHHVVLYNRTSCCGERLRDITIGFYDTNDVLIVNSPLLNPGNVLGSPATLSFTCATPVNARYVKVTRTATGVAGNHDANALSMAEVEIYADNLAYSQPVTQSSTWPGLPASNANDGNPSDYSHTQTSPTPCWWEVDLGANYEVNSVLMLNRPDCCPGRLRDITVSVLDASLSTVYSSPLLNPANALGGPKSLGVDIRFLNGAPVLGRYVRVTRTPDGGGDDNIVLALAEVQVYGSVPSGVPPGITTQPQNQYGVVGGGATFTVGAVGTEPLAYQWFKSGTGALANQTNAALTLANLTLADVGSYSVSITNAFGTSNSSSATLTVYVWNAARGGSASQSTTDNGGVAGRANDGNTDGNWGAGSVTHTGNTPIDNEWWEVNLGTLTYVDRIHVWFRTDCCSQRNENLRLVIYDDPVTRNVLWTQNVGATPGPNKGFTVSPPTLGRVVRVEHIPATGMEVLSLAEVQVFEGVHGQNLVWVGGTTGNAWDLTNTVNWKSSAGPEIFHPRDNVTFDDSSSETNVSLVGTLEPLSVNVSSDRNYLFQGSGKITGGGLIKSGNGTVTLANSDVNLFALGTLVSQGTLQIGDGGTAGLLAGAISNNATLVFNRSDAVTSSGVLSGSGLFVKAGAGTLTLTAQPAYTGNTVVNAGVLEFYSPGLFTYNGGDLFINNGSTLKFSGSRYDLSGKTYTFDGNGGGVLDTSSGINFVAWADNTFRTTGGAQNSIIGASGMNINSGVTDVFDLTRGTGASDLKVTAPMWNAGGISKTGNGILELAGANRYGGNTTISGGTVKVTGGVYTDSYRTAMIYVQSGAVLELETWAYGAAESLGQLSAGNQLQIDNGTIRVNGTTSYGRGLTVLAGGATIETGPGGNWNIDITHDSSPWTFTDNPSLRFTGAGNGIFEKDFSSGGALIKDGPGTWTLAGTNNCGSGLTLNMGSLFVNGASTGAVAVVSGTTLGGSGIIAGAVALPDGTLLTPGGTPGAIGTLTVSSLSLTNVLLDYQLGTTTSEGAGANDLIQVNGDLALSGVTTVRVSFAASPVLSQPYTLINYSGAFSGDPTNLVVFNETRATFVLDFSVTNKVRLTVTSGVGSLTWLGLNPNSNWDTTNIANWDNGITGADIFYNGDSVTFVNDPNTWTVELVGTLKPAQVNMLADQDYLLQGNGKIIGALLNLSGGGTLTLANSDTNYFALGTLISSGTLQIGHGGATGVLPEGPLTNNATLAFNRSDDVTISRALVGTGLVRKEGPNTLAFSSANPYSGGTLVNAGTLLVQNNAGLGDFTSSITVNPGGTLDLGSSELWNYTLPIVISGPGATPTAGALTKSVPTMVGLNQIRSLTLGSNASIGGVAGARFDIGRGDWPGPIPVGPIHLDGQGHTLSLVGGIYLGILAGAQNLAGIIINSGTSVAPHNDNSFGDAIVTLNGGILTPWGPDHYFANPLVINSGYINNQAYMHTYTGPVQVNGPVEINTISGGNITFSGNITGVGNVTKIGAYTVLLGGDNSGFSGSWTNNESNIFFDSTNAGSASAAWVLNNGALGNRVVGTATIMLGSLAGSGGLLGNNLANPDSGQVTFVIGSNNTSATFSGQIIDAFNQVGTVALVKSGLGTQTLAGQNSYSGGTLVNSGTLRYDGTLMASAGTVTVLGGTLSGNGMLNVPVQVLASGTLAPGASVGVLTISNTLALAGTTVMEIDKANQTNDLVRGLAGVTYGGTLVVTNLGGGLAHGDTFKLFDATSYSGQFGSLQLPELPPGTMWDTSTLTVNGSITAVTNRAPVAFNTNASTTKNRAVEIAAAKLLEGCSDPDGDALAMVSVSNSTNGAIVSLPGTNITYTPVTDFVGADLFTYTITDGKGGFATGAVEVLVYPGDLPTLNIVSVQRVGSDLQFTFAGIPGRSYQVERALEVTGPWTNVAVMVAAPTGLTTFVDTNSPAGSAYYRTLYP